MHQAASKSFQTLNTPARSISARSTSFLVAANHPGLGNPSHTHFLLNSPQSRNIRFIPDLQRIRRFSPLDSTSKTGYKDADNSNQSVDNTSSTTRPPSAYSTSPTNPGNPFPGQSQANIYTPPASTTFLTTSHHDPHHRHGSKRIPSQPRTSVPQHRKQLSSSDAEYQNISTDYHPHDLACKYHPPFAPHSPVGSCTSQSHAHPLSDPILPPTPAPIPGPFSPTKHLSAPDKKPASMSDEDYAAFLEKSSADQSGSASASTRSKSKSKENKSVTTQTATVPKALQHSSFKDRTYTTETDAPFEAVSLKYEGSGGKLKVDDVAGFAGAKSGDVEEVGVQGFDPRGEYADLVEAVEKAASGGKAQVFRVGRSGARCEYWVLGVDGEEGRVVGWKVDAVES